MTAALPRLSADLADRYRIERELGAGGMATVYLAEDLKHHRKVAIKVLHAELSAILGPERFLKEIELTANLQHRHILPLFDSGSADGLLYYVMPFVEGETLRARLDREKQLSVADAVRIATETADALDYAHRHGIVHRDIKPENVLLHDGHVLVADFGIALAVEQAGGQRMTQTGLSLGTPQYMAPEQAMGERDIGPRADVYALGAVTYEMLAGQAPFTGPNAQAIVAQVLTTDPPLPSAHRRSVPSSIDAAVETALAKLPADRFAHAADFAAALERPVVAAPKTRRARTAVAAWLIGLLAAGTAGWGAARWLDRDTVAMADDVTVTSILPPPGGSFDEQRSLALSADGRRLAFVFTTADGSRSLWMRTLDRLDATPVPGSDGADAPFWSPGGRALGFFAGGFLVVRDEGGEVRRLCPVSHPTGGSWGASGTILFGDRVGLWTVPSAGGRCTPIVRRGSDVVLRGILLPDGKRLLYSRGAGRDIVAASLDGRTLATIPVRAREFAFVPPDHLLAPDSIEPGAVDEWPLRMHELTLAGGARRVVSNTRYAAGVNTITFSTNGAVAYLPSSAEVEDRPYLVYDASGQLRDSVRMDGAWTVTARPASAGPPLVAVAGDEIGVWLYDIGTHRRSRLLGRDTVKASGERPSLVWPVFDPNGTRLLYAAITDSRCELVERDLKTDAERVLLRDSVADFTRCPIPVDWSPGGRLALLRADTALRVLALDGTSSYDITRPGQLWEGRFSPDGRWIAYSDDETGRTEVYVQALPKGQPVRVSSDGGRWPAWTHSGRSLTFITPDGRVQTADLGSAPGSAGGAPRTLFTVTRWRRSIFDDAGVGFAVVGDGERYIVRQSPSAAAVALVQNWPALLRLVHGQPESGQ